MSTVARNEGKWKLSVIMVRMEIGVTIFENHLAICGEGEGVPRAVGLYCTEILTEVHRGHGYGFSLWCNL